MGVASRADALEKQVATLRDELAKASATPAADPAMQERITALEAGVAETGKFADRVGALEAGGRVATENPLCSRGEDAQAILNAE